jgi:single-stranded-DNA-specific exonuclease
MGMDPLVTRILSLRGLDENSAELFLNGTLAKLPDPYLMKGMGRSVARLIDAIRRRQRIEVHGDYDADGVTGTAVLVQALRSFGADVGYSIPLRLRDGYGLSRTAIEQAARNRTRVIVSVDCGISATEEASLARELGIDLIVTDHHQIPEELPRAYSIVNPHQPGCAFPFKELAGVGVAFFLAVALRKALRDAAAFRDRPEPDLKKLLDLVAIGTIADIVPLLGVNRILTRAGLTLMETAPRPGIAALQQAAGIKRISCGTIAFGIGPRINASGRIEDAALGVELLLGGGFDEAMRIAAHLNDLNQQRQDIEAQTVEQAIERIEKGATGRRSIVLADSRWHPGVIGICASRLVERYHRPTVLIAQDGGKGKASARSIRGFHLYEQLQACSSLLLGFGGHEYAAGLSIEEKNIQAFAEAFDARAQLCLSEQDLRPELCFDAEMPVGNLTLPVVETLSALAPFGAGNPGPVFVTRQVRAEKVRVLKGKHLAFLAIQDGNPLRCIAFGRGEDAQGLEGRRLDLLYQGTVNEWQGSRSVQAEIKDFRAV